MGSAEWEQVCLFVVDFKRWRKNLSASRYSGRADLSSEEWKPD